MQPLDRFWSFVWPLWWFVAFPPRSRTFVFNLRICVCHRWFPSGDDEEEGAAGSSDGLGQVGVLGIVAASIGAAVVVFVGCGLVICFLATIIERRLRRQVAAEVINFWRHENATAFHQMETHAVMMAMIIIIGLYLIIILLLPSSQF